MKLVDKTIETWNGIEKIRLAKDFPAQTELQWNDILNSYYTRLITTQKEDIYEYDEFVAFYNHIVKQLNIKTI
tara:strand:- start:1479 stop:1697 length:219 start_codon:yes stop_codon:yes gene_type:complete